MNKVDVICPACSKRFRIAPELIGRKGRCQDCGHVFDLIVAEPDVASVYGFAAEEPATDPDTVGPDTHSGSADGAADSAAANNIAETHAHWTCPHCHQGYAADTTICVTCGYNHLTGQLLSTTVASGPVTAADPARLEIPPDKTRMPAGVVSLFVLLALPGAALLALLFWDIVYNTKPFTEGRLLVGGIALGLNLLAAVGLWFRNRLVYVLLAGTAGMSLLLQMTVLLSTLVVLNPHGLRDFPQMLIASATILFAGLILICLLVKPSRRYFQLDHIPAPIILAISLIGMVMLGNLVTMTLRSVFGISISGTPAVGTVPCIAVLLQFATLIGLVVRNRLIRLLVIVFGTLSALGMGCLYFESPRDFRDAQAAAVTVGLGAAVSCTLVICLLMRSSKRYFELFCPECGLPASAADWWYSSMTCKRCGVFW